MEPLPTTFYKYIKENQSAHDHPQITFIEGSTYQSDHLFRIIPKNNLHHYSSQGIHLHQVQVDLTAPQLICRPSDTDPDQWVCNKFTLGPRLSLLEKNKLIFSAGCFHRHINFLETRVRFAIYEQDEELLKYMGKEVDRLDLDKYIIIPEKVLDIY